MDCSSCQFPHPWRYSRQAVLEWLLCPSLGIFPTRDQTSYPCRGVNPLAQRAGTQENPPVEVACIVACGPGHLAVWNVRLFAWLPGVADAPGLWTTLESNKDVTCAYQMGGLIFFLNL